MNRTSIDILKIKPCGINRPCRRLLPIRWPLDGLFNCALFFKAMKELPHFRFHPDEWLTGDITLESFETQGVFINICAYLWKKDNSVAMAKLKQRYGRVKNSIWDILFTKNLLKTDSEGNVFIEFLREQLEAIKNNSKVLSEFGAQGAKKRWGGYGVAINKNSILDKDKDKDKEYDKDKDGVTDNKIENSPLNKRKVFIKPSLNEVSEYISENKYSVKPEKWYSYYESNGWKIGKNSMKDWKAAIRTWQHNNLDNSKKIGLVD